MEIIGPLLVSTIAGFSTVLGAFVVFLKIDTDKRTKFISFCLSFSLAVMIGISLLDLIPNSLQVLFHHDLNKGLIGSVIAFITGIFSIKLLISKVEKAKMNTNSLYKLGILNMIALMLHNFPEGVATFLSSYQNMAVGIHLGMAILLHNIPEGISIAVPIYYATNSKKEAIKKTFFSGFAEPVGAILAFLFFRNFITDEFISIILLFVAGIMITISIEEIFPETLKYKESPPIIIGFLLGVLLLVFNHFFL